MDDLQTHLVENDCHSPLYGIYIEGEQQHALALQNLETRSLAAISGAKTWSGIGRPRPPIKPNALWRSRPFWLKMGFGPVMPPLPATASNPLMSDSRQEWNGKIND
jgi:hypothetical protein